MEARSPYPTEQDTPSYGEIIQDAKNEKSYSDEKRYNLAELIFDSVKLEKTKRIARVVEKLEDTIWQMEDLPEELKHELRSEHKDDPQGHQPVHISGVVSSTPTRQPGLSKAINNRILADKTDENVVEENTTLRVNLMIYRRSVIIGFATAVIILLFIILLISLFQIQ